MRCHPRKKNIKKPLAGAVIYIGTKAIDFFDNLHLVTSKLIKHVELWANSVSRQVVSAKQYLVSASHSGDVFPAPTGVTEYEGHVGSMSRFLSAPFLFI